MKSITPSPVPEIVSVIEVPFVCNAQTNPITHDMHSGVLLHACPGLYRVNLHLKLKLAGENPEDTAFNAFVEGFENIYAELRPKPDEALQASVIQLLRLDDCSELVWKIGKETGTPQVEGSLLIALERLVTFA